jgi:hypothetical protein
MKVGVTGTREGATEYQLYELRRILQELKGTEFHHGDCKGVDEQAAAIAKELGYKIVCHPPEKNYLRAYFPYDEAREPAGYLKRDRAIVDSVDILLVVPLHEEWQSKGGTWYTHDYAKKLGRVYNIIWPKEKT